MMRCNITGGAGQPFGSCSPFGDSPCDTDTHNSKKPTHALSLDTAGKVAVGCSWGNRYKYCDFSRAAGLTNCAQDLGKGPCGSTKPLLGITELPSGRTGVMCYTTGYFECSRGPTAVPSLSPAAVPTSIPSCSPTAAPSLVPTGLPSTGPTAVPTTAPSVAPTAPPIPNPTSKPSGPPTLAPTSAPAEPTDAPSTRPSTAPSQLPSTTPSRRPSSDPSASPSRSPTEAPTVRLPTLEAAAPEATTAITSTAAFLASPSAGQLALIGGVHCDAVFRQQNKTQDPLPFPLHPLRFDVGGSRELGCVVGNAVLLVVTFCLSLIPLAVLRRLDDSGDGMISAVEAPAWLYKVLRRDLDAGPQDIKALARFPGGVLMVFLVLHQGITFAALRLVFIDGGASSVIGIAAAGLRALVGRDTGFALVRDWPRYPVGPVIHRRPGPLFRVLLWGPGEWVSRTRLVHWAVRYLSVRRLGGQPGHAAARRAGPRGDGVATAQRAPLPPAAAGVGGSRAR
eukprot:TRINITY_DN35282_c0_g1_i1.p1 TRINITY_DN35282_c0_g1~~TRINITY_DN35282_c0_g1_i1.p1  ORF type:complete len:545 (+),score=42.92 TRINITY_DN35282_c0_g1_i1:112-1635(+)